MRTISKQYLNLTDAGGTLIQSKNVAEDTETVTVEKLLITNTDTTTVEISIWLYLATATPTTVYILKAVPIKVGETLDVFVDTPFKYDGYYALLADAAAGHTADVIINYY